MEAVLFDLDGTLVDTAPDFYRVLNQMLTDDGLDNLSYADVRKTVSDGARALIKLAYGLDEGDQGFNEKRQRLLDLYLAGIAIKSDLFEGLHEMVLWLQSTQLPMAIVTNKPRLYAEALLSDLHLNDKPLAHYTASLVCPDDVQNRKPHPEPLFKACKEMQVTPQQCIYVGDHVRDIESGKAANMKTIAAGFGYVHSDHEAKDWQADWTINTSSELLPLLKTLKASWPKQGEPKSGSI